MTTHTGFIHTLLFPSLLWKMPGKKIFLTFDDGPHSVATPIVLDTLKRHNVRGTFFISGRNIEGREKIIERIVAENHSIGIHAFNHTRTIAFSKEKTRNEILSTQHLLSKFTNQKIRLFRPPFGFFSWKTIAAAKELNFILTMWSCLTGDFRNWSDEKITQTALHKLQRGSILVFHDNDLTENKIEGLLDIVIHEIRRRGFEFGAIR